MSSLCSILSPSKSQTHRVWLKSKAVIQNRDSHGFGKWLPSAQLVGLNIITVWVRPHRSSLYQNPLVNMSSVPHLEISKCKQRHRIPFIESTENQDSPDQRISKFLQFYALENNRKDDQPNERTHMESLCVKHFKTPVFWSLTTLMQSPLSVRRLLQMLGKCIPLIKQSG